MAISHLNLPRKLACLGGEVWFECTCGGKVTTQAELKLEPEYYAKWWKDAWGSVNARRRCRCCGSAQRSQEVNVTCGRNAFDLPRTRQTTRRPRRSQTYRSAAAAAAAEKAWLLLFHRQDKKAPPPTETPKDARLFTSCLLPRCDDFQLLRRVGWQICRKDQDWVAQHRSVSRCSRARLRLPRSCLRTWHGQGIVLNL